MLATIVEPHIQRDYAILRDAVRVAEKHLTRAVREERRAEATLHALETAGYPGNRAGNELHDARLGEARRLLREAEVRHYDVFQVFRHARDAAAKFRSIHRDELALPEIPTASDNNPLDLVERRLGKQPRHRVRHDRRRTRCRPDQHECGRDCCIRRARRIRDFETTNGLAERFLDLQEAA